MATMFVKIRVANFEKWRKVYDRLERIREQHGFFGHSIYRDASDPNIVLILNHAKDMAEAKKFGASQTLHDAMAEAGVQGPPEIAFLDGVEELYVGARA
jgi:hypothetical protein